MPQNETPYVREDGYAERYRDRRFATGSGPRTDRRERRAIARLLRAVPPRLGTWLDVPSGSGRMSDLLPGEVVQVDRAPAMLAAIEQPGIARLCASVHQLPFADDAFVGALCHRLLHHIPSSAERIRILSELRRVVAGPLIVSFFHAASLQHARRTLSRRLRRKPTSGRCAVTLRRFLGDLNAAGWRAEACAPLAPFVSEQWLVRATRAPSDQRRTP